MTTTREIVTSALRMLGITPGDQEPAAVDSTRVLERLNDMLVAWETQGVTLYASPLVLDQTATIEPRHVRGVKALLAVEIAEEFGAAIPPYVTQVARDGWQALQSEHMVVPDASFDTALLRTPSRRILEET